MFKVGSFLCNIRVRILYLGVDCIVFRILRGILCGDVFYCVVRDVRCSNLLIILEGML